MEDKHEQGVGIIVHENITKSVIGFQAISSRILVLRLKATPFNVTIIQVYAPTTEYSDQEIETFYDKIQNVIQNTAKKDILIVQSDWNSKVGVNAHKVWEGTCGINCNPITNYRGLRLLEFASSNELIIANTYGKHKESRIWTWHSPNNAYHNQIDYILTKRRFRSSVNLQQTITFPAADVGSDYDLVMMTFRLKLKRVKKDKFNRIKFDLNKLKSPSILDQFNSIIGAQFNSLINLNDTEFDVDEMTIKFNNVLYEKATETIGKGRTIKKSWMNERLLELCDERRKLKKEMKVNNSSTEYRRCNKKVRKEMKKAK